MESYIFRVVGKRKYWDGKIQFARAERSSKGRYTRQRRTKMQRRVLDAVKPEWVPSFRDEIIYENDRRKAEKKLLHYNLQRALGANKKNFPEIAIHRVLFEPVIKEALTTAPLEQLREATRIAEHFGSTMAESYARINFGGENPIMAIAVKRKGSSIEAMKALGKGYSYGMYTFFPSRAQMVHARLVVGEKIDRVYYLQESGLNTVGAAAL